MRDRPPPLPARSTQGAASHLSPLGDHDRRIDPIAPAWAEAIDDPEARDEAVVRAGHILHRRDAAAARSWLADSGLPPELQAKVLNPPKKVDERRDGARRR